MVPLHERWHVPPLVWQSGVRCQLGKNGVEIKKLGLTLYRRFWLALAHKSTEFYFHRGVTYSHYHQVQ